MMEIKLRASIAAVAAVTALAVVPAAAQAVPHWYKGKKPVVGTVVVPTKGSLTFKSPSAVIKCKVNDTEEIWNPSTGGPGEDLVTAFNLSACKVIVSTAACPKKGSTPVVGAAGLPWPSVLIPGTPIRDEILKVRIRVACNAGAVPEEYEGTLTPEVQPGKLVFGGAGGGTLEEPISKQLMEVIGNDAIPGISAKDP